MGNDFFSLLLYHFYYFQGNFLIKTVNLKLYSQLNINKIWMNISNLKDNCWWLIVQFSLLYSFSLVSSAVPTFSHLSDHRFPKLFFLGSLEASVAYLVVAFFLLGVDALGLLEVSRCGPMVAQVLRICDLLFWASLFCFG